MSSEVDQQDKLHERQAERQRQRDEEQAKRKMRQQQHQQNLQTAAQRQIEEERAIYLDKLMETDMSDAGIKMLENMVDQSFVLGNISDAEYHDIKWHMRSLYVKIRASFPPEESCVEGDVRAFVLDNYDEDLEPLTGQQRNIIAQMIRGIMLRVSRSKDGFQQEMNVKSISVSEVMDADEQEEDGLKYGLFGGS